MCASCVYTAGQKVGMLSPHQGDELKRQLDHARENVIDLQLELQEEKDNRVVSLKDARELFGANLVAADAVDRSVGGRTLGKQVISK